MSFYNTGNPVPSDDPRDLDDNAKIIDVVATSTELSTTDRKGRAIRTLAGLQYDASQGTLRTDLAAPGGLGLVGFDEDLSYPNDSAGKSLADAKKGIGVLAKTQDLVYRKSVGLSLPLKPQNYDAAKAAANVLPGGSLYPQGHCYDGDENLFIFCGGNTAGVIFWYTKAGAYGGWFLVSNGGESIAIAEVGGVRTLYKNGGSANLVGYNVTTIPTTGSSPSAISTSVTGVGLQLAYSKGRWIIEQSAADVGVQNSRTKWMIFDDAFTPKGSFYVSKNVIGWQLATSPYYNYVPKSQGVTLRGDKVIFGLGGSYIPDIDGPVSPISSSVGVAECNLDGSIAAYGAVRADKMVAKLVAAGHNCVRTESEGISTRPDGSLSHMIITLRPSSPGWETEGILIFTEQDSLGDDYSSIAEQYVPFSLPRTYSGVFPRSLGGIFDPLTHTAFTTMDQIIQYMAYLQVPRFSWYSSSVNITPLAGIVIPSSALLEIMNANNGTYIVTVSVSGLQVAKYSVSNAIGSSTYNVVKLGVDAALVRISAIDGGLNTVARITAPNKSNASQDLLVLQQQSTDSANALGIGGGSGAFGGATRILLWNTSTLSGSGGTIIAEVMGTGVRPGANASFTIGESALRWSDVFSGQYTIGTSTVRMLSGAGSPEGVVTAVVGSTYQRNNGGAVTSLYVKETGTGNTGWVAK